MKCPVDGATLVMADRSGIEIDYCPECRGVWLDRGELDKIVDRVSAEEPSYGRQEPERHHREDHDRYDHRDRDHDRDRGYDRDRDHGRAYGHKKKKGGFIGEIFEGFGD